MRPFRLLIAAILAAALTAAVPSPDAELVRAIIAYDELPTTIELDLAAAGVEQAVVFEAIDGVAVTAPKAVVELLADDPSVLGVQAERRLRMHLFESVEQIGAQGVEDDDPYTVGTESGPVDRVRPGVDGTGQTVAVIDTGIWDVHPDLLGKVTHFNFEFQYAGEGIFSAEQIDLYAEATGQAGRVDDWGHGTHVAGIVAGTGEGSAGRVNHGVAPGAALVDLKIADLHNGLPDDAGWERNALAAIDWVIRHHADDAFGPNGIGVVNNSWGLTGTDTLFEAPRYDLLEAAIDEVVNGEGVVFVFAAGNDGPGEDTIGRINGLDEVITVTAACKPKTTASGCMPTGPGIASFSSRGPEADVAAPGVEIMSANAPASLVGPLGQLGGDYGGSRTDQVQNRALYTSASGTSMAAPHVAGLVALMLEVNPDLTPAQVEQILIETADYHGASETGFDTAWGHGLVNTVEVLRAAHDLVDGAR
ncbi:MAG: S8 family serine peptidase [Nitriliruptorales bacterium]|nr:S8 family serine peptidase [Nitriliruptorales bacterium]